MCLEERRPLPTNSCCSAEHVKGAMGDLGVVLKFGKAYSMAHPLMTSKKNRGLDVWGLWTEIRSVLWLERYRSSQHSWWRFGQGKNDWCVEGLQKTLCSISATRDRPFAVQGRLRLYLPWKLQTMKTEVCCCPEQSVRKAGEKKCKEVESAEKEKFIFQKTPVLDKQTVESHGDFGYLVWQQVSLKPWNPAEKAPVWLEDIEPESKVKFQWRKWKLQNASIECAKWERLRTASVEKSYCLKHKMTLVCDAGQVLYEQVPGYDLHQDEFACREGLKNNVEGDPDYDERCHCQWEKPAWCIVAVERFSPAEKMELRQYLGVRPPSWWFSREMNNFPCPHFFTKGSLKKNQALPKTRVASLEAKASLFSRGNPWKSLSLSSSRGGFAKRPNALCTLLVGDLVGVGAMVPNQWDEGHFQML